MSFLNSISYDNYHSIQFGVDDINNMPQEKKVA